MTLLAKIRCDFTQKREKIWKRGIMVEKKLLPPPHFFVFLLKIVSIFSLEPDYKMRHGIYHILSYNTGHFLSNLIFHQ